MVNPRWNPKIANSRVPVGKANTDTTQQEFSIPAPEEYVGSYIKSDVDGKKVSNKSYEKYYKGMI